MNGDGMEGRGWYGMEWDILVTPSRRMRDEKMQQQLLHSPRSKGGHDEMCVTG